MLQADKLKALLEQKDQDMCELEHQHAQHALQQQEEQRQKSQQQHLAAQGEHLAAHKVSSSAFLSTHAWQK